MFRGAKQCLRRRHFLKEINRRRFFFSSHVVVLQLYIHYMNLAKYLLGGLICPPVNVLASIVVYRIRTVCAIPARGLEPSTNQGIDRSSSSAGIGSRIFAIFLQTKGLGFDSAGDRNPGAKNHFIF